ncbi:ribosome recycling factor [Cyclobacterium sp. 1_MG-2023]|uniref:ribosome recycling factor n=1 Tax=Cyclobacterium sp. 1_MG-2023 TaxID=3062681 RepID=UPI0026E11F42|nr:ribosome recycling factor [Cyclobacterium sp. 1_MG-2023]MDO6438372.1 ribosome recycling factor [Cyclobacterium sp. 1_MG-2023]
MEEIQLYLEEAKSLMDKAVQHTIAELIKIRAGKAMPNFLDGIMVVYYGNPTPLQQVASITTPDARTLAIKPWEQKLIPEVEKAIINSDLGLNPQNNGEMVLLSVPPLTEERRKNLVKQVKNECENGKISIRNVRKDTNDGLRKLQKEGVAEDDVKRAEDTVQKMTDQHSAKIDELYAKKEAEIMTI